MTFIYIFICCNFLKITQTFKKNSKILLISWPLTVLMSLKFIYRKFFTALFLANYHQRHILVTFFAICFFILWLMQVHYASSRIIYFWSLSSNIYDFINNNQETILNDSLNEIIQGAGIGIFASIPLIYNPVNTIDYCYLL